MKTEKEIIKDAKDSYMKNFKDAEYVKEDVPSDVLLDQDKLRESINKMKDKEEKKHESLEVLRKQLEKDAEGSYEKTFGKDQGHEVKQKLSVFEMEEQLEQEKEKLFKTTEELKKKQMNH